MRWFVRLFENTPVFWPSCYFLLAGIALVLAAGRPVLRALLASGLLFALTMCFFAPAPDYRYTHWLVTTTCVSIAALAVGRRAAWRRT